MPTTLTIIPVTMCQFYSYVLSKETNDGRSSLMTTTINDNQNPIEAAITHFIKETGNTAIKGYFELNPIVYNDHTNKIVVLYTTSSDTYNKDYGWTNNDNIDDLFIPGNDYTITDPLVYTAMLLLKEYNILDDNEEDLIVLAHKDHPFHHFEINTDTYRTSYYCSAPTKRELNSLLKLIDKWNLTIDDSIDNRIGLCTDKDPDYAIAIDFNIDNSYNLTTYNKYNEETKTFDTYQKLINYADRWFTKQTKED
jgi:hypothetical protein